MNKLKEIAIKKSNPKKNERSKNLHNSLNGTLKTNKICIHLLIHFSFGIYNLLKCSNNLGNNF